MIEYDENKTKQFFNKVYHQVDIERGRKPESRLHPRDHILLKHILPSLAPDCRALDYGCGQGRLLATLLERGVGAEGMEKHEDMRSAAVAATAPWTSGRERVLLGTIGELANLGSGTYDLVIAMGVFQYLPKAEYERTLGEFRRVLKPGGALVATFQNALFDLYTFNKYTIDFMMVHFVLPYVEDSAADAIKSDLDALLSNPDQPAWAMTRARDNIFVHLTNPLTIDEHLNSSGFRVSKKYFYEFFGMPPLIASKHGSLSRSIATRFEIDNASAWEGHFMANAFLIHARRT